jgi:hypothetical protein
MSVLMSPMPTNPSFSADGKLGPSSGKSALMVAGVKIRKTFVDGQIYGVS